MASIPEDAGEHCDATYAALWYFISLFGTVSVWGAGGGGFSTDWTVNDVRRRNAVSS